MGPSKVFSSNSEKGIRALFTDEFNDAIIVTVKKTLIIPSTSQINLRRLCFLQCFVLFGFMAVQAVWEDFKVFSVLQLGEN